MGRFDIEQQQGEEEEEEGEGNNRPFKATIRFFWKINVRFRYLDILAGRPQYLK